MSRLSPDALEQFFVRVSMLFAAGFIFAEGLQNWIRGRVETHPEVVLLIIVSYALAFVLFLLATVNMKGITRLRDVAFGSLIFATVASWYVVTQIEHPGSYQTDALAFVHYSAILLSKGINPYPQDLQSALSMFSVSPEFITLTPGGNLVSTLNYPALQVIAFLPAVWAGLRDARIIIYVFEIATLVIIYLWAPKEIRPLALIPLFAGSDLAINFSAGSIADFIWILPLVLMVVYMDRPLVAGIMFGLASAVKQTPWLLAPYLLIWFFRTESGLKLQNRLMRVGGFTGAAVAAFLIPNLWFMFEDFGAWYSGVVTPAFGNLVVLSQGLSLITLANGVPLPPAFYLVATLAVAAALVVEYYVYFERLAFALWAFPAIILWFSYRGLQNYFIFWTPLLVMSAVMLYRRGNVARKA
ncbi:MAG: glycosyltransferase 87 family protein [Candidatus Bathyarchaeia archaeon]|jgi:uncharacterized membrane protein